MDKLWGLEGKGGGSELTWEHEVGRGSSGVVRKGEGRLVKAVGPW